ncbi:MAG: pyridoxal phosphate-dependent aminotransferase [Theionarchaea archaeon]|nr:pyridoxal phosphate-dependent aminotransferase [Theionarchaea archaeon]
MSSLISGTDCLKPDPIRSFVRKANDLEKETGRKIVRLNIGQPDLPPGRILEAYKRGLVSSDVVESSKYPPAEGLPELREAIARMEGRCFGVDAPDSRVYVTLGGCGALKFTFKVLGAREGKRKNLIAMAPGWGVISNFTWEYEVETRFARLETPDGKFDANLAQEMLNEDTVAIYVNSPNNPTGSILAEKTVRDILSFAEDNDIWVISDEAYQHLIHAGLEDHTSFMKYEEYTDRVFKCISFSKILKPNIRLGGLLLPRGLDDDVMASFFTALRNEGAGVSAESQSGALEVLRVDPGLSYMGEVAQGYKEKVDIAKQILLDAGCVFESYNNPLASFYLFPRTPFEDSRELTEILLNEGVSVVPGTSFHLDSHIRIAIGANMTPGEVEEGTKRVAATLEKVR